MIWHLLGIRVKVVKVGSPLDIVGYGIEADIALLCAYT